MNVRLKNFLLIAAVAALTIFPLISLDASSPSSGGQQSERFTGTDGQATALIKEIAPDYRPWFSSIFEPPGGEIEGLLFALQAALGAGIIGYYLGYCRGQAKTADESADSTNVA